MGPLAFMSFLSVLLWPALQGPSVGAAQVSGGLLTPSSTRVAILPVVNESGEKREKTALEQCQYVTDALQRQFRDRGFQIVEPQVVAAAMTKLEADMSDEEQRKRARMIEIGREAGADLVVFVVIMDKGKDIQGMVASIKVWLLDAKTNQPYLSAKVFEGLSRAQTAFNMPKMKRALPLAVDRALKDFMKPYKIVK